MIEQKFILIPLIGFLIGSFTNYLAIKMLFHPRKKVFGIQGLIPKRRKILAMKISEAAFEIMPEEFRKAAKIPFVGERLEGIFKEAVQKQVNKMSNEELEKIVINVMKKELNFVVFIGGFIGLLIGVLQLLLVL